MADAAERILAGRIDADVLSVEPGGRLEYAVVNCGGVPILFGEAYELDRLSTSGWLHVPLPWGFRLIGYGLSPGDRRQMTAPIPDDAAAGRYRVRKQLRADPAVEQGANELAPMQATVEFSVERAQV